MKTINLVALLFVLLLGCSENENVLDPPELELNARYKLTFNAVWSMQTHPNLDPPVLELNARYNLTFNATWSVQTHPNEFPTSAHFSGLIGMTHNGNAMLFANGELASDGIKNMAETGSKNPLGTEIQNFISNGTGFTLISDGGIGSSPGEVSLEFDIIISGKCSFNVSAQPRLVYSCK